MPSMRSTKDMPYSSPWELLTEGILNLLDLNSMYGVWCAHKDTTRSAGHWEVRRRGSNQIVCTVLDDNTRNLQAWLEAITLEHVQPDW